MKIIVEGKEYTVDQDSIDMIKNAKQRTIDHPDLDMSDVQGIMLDITDSDGKDTATILSYEDAFGYLDEE